jgi:hypothetical protein
MSNFSLEIRFLEGKFKGQIWTLSNLDVSDLMVHYENLPMIFLREAELFVHTGEKKIDISDFIEEYFFEKKKPLLIN